MYFKAKNISFADSTMKIKNLCVYGEHYFFESDAEIPQAEIATDEEFEQAISSIVHVTPEPVEPEPTQLDRIEAEIMKSNDELRQEGADALTEELIAMGII